ncbi:GTP-binding protein [Sporomusa termitida]|uniref:CobW: cobalamin biosynthesis protein CobW n=1 Tax=Sporomusa termitida TaxID=2377 RepID=A0A517DW63_9FIRM|nr:GTP-binding protein [Sporomusa termitida]QDR81577.1 CobW: cobalamin biosynthesis protein CobW [Sporomusa termitida]
MKTKLILVGGFLGAGKTTLLGEAACRLSQAGKQVGLITNDQAAELVDTVLLEYTNALVSEVSGSCFCCNFPGFTAAIAYITEKEAVDVIIAEPVGSCTDLSATILQPLKDKFADTLRVAPLSVLVDPQQLIHLLDGRVAGLHPSAVYILRKQLEEADFIIINKADRLSPATAAALQKRTAAEWPWAKVYVISAKSGDGLENWLNDVLQSAAAGKRLAEVDYDIYAEGEAVLGWLNTTVHLQHQSADWDSYANQLLNALQQRLAELPAAVGHVKLLVKTGSGFVLGNITGPDNLITVRGSAGVGQAATMTLNARAQMEPESLQAIVLEEISKAGGSAVIAEFAALKCLKPGHPKPTYRYNQIIAQVAE